MYEILSLAVVPLSLNDSISFPKAASGGLYRLGVLTQSWAFTRSPTVTG